MGLRDKRRIEVATSGIDEALQGLTSDPIGLALSQATGLRIPPVLPGYTTPLAQPRYRFCLASRRITGKTRLVGIRQGVTLGVDANYGSPPVRPIEMQVVTPAFKFPDGNISWHLVRETGRLVTSFRSSDTAGWQHLETDASAMLYDAATFAGGTFDPTTGAPYFYNIGLTTYAPPNTASRWTPIGGYGNFHDLRFGWYANQAWGTIDEKIEGDTRISLYADILQTNPATRTALPAPPSTTWQNPGGTPEEAFITTWTQTGEGPTQGPIYWRVYGALIFEDYPDEDQAP